MSARKRKWGKFKATNGKWYYNPFRRFFIIILLLLTGCTLNPRPWTVQEKQAATFFMLAHTGNAFSTHYILDNGMHERNPVLGRYPSDREVTAYFSITGIGTIVLAHFCPQVRRDLLLSYGALNTGLAIDDFGK